MPHNIIQQERMGTIELSRDTTMVIWNESRPSAEKHKMVGLHCLKRLVSKKMGK